MSDSSIEGTCDPRFSAVRDVFAHNFSQANEVGAAVSVVVDGRCVVDLWGGHADQARTRAWGRSTPVNVFSTTKAMAALCAHRLVDAGRLDLDAPVARYWPEFAAAGKAGVSVRDLLSHRAGLAAVRDPLPPEALYDWEAMTQALAAETPWWTPGTAHGYHAVTFGWLIGEVVRRIAGKSLGAVFRDEIAGPLGAEFRIGVPDGDHAAIAEMSTFSMEPPGDGEPGLLEIVLKDPQSVTARAFGNPSSLMAGPNVPEWRRAEIPGANGHATARGLARIYGALARAEGIDGVSVLSRESVERCRTEHSHGPDLVLHVSTRFGLGFMLPQGSAPGTRFGPNPGSFGHPGAGGSVGFADPETRLGFGYVMNRMGPHILLDPRATRLIDAAYAALES